MVQTELKIMKLNKIGNIFSGNSINAKTKKEKYFNIPKGTPYVATKDVSYNSVIDYDNGIKIPNSDLEKFRIAHKNSILICAEGGSAGRKLAFNTQDICFVNKLFALEPFDFMEPRYIFYFYHTSDFQEQFKSRMTGLIGGVSMGKFKDIDIPVPPLPIQKKIVEILDSAFEKITKAKENSEQNLKNAKEVFESYLQKVFENKGEDWEETTLNRISENLDGKRKPITKKYREEGEIPYYGASGIVDYVKDFIFNEDLLLVSEDGANLLARTYPIAFSISGKTWVNNHAHVLRFQNIFSQKFVELYLNSIKLDPFVSGMAQPKLNQKMLNKIPIPFPKSIEEQKQLALKFDNLSEQTKQLEDIYSQKLSCLEELKQSILQKAFKGELTEVSS